MSTGLVALILFGTLFLLFLLKMPIGFSLMISSILVMVLTGTGLEMVPKRLFTSCGTRLHAGDCQRHRVYSER